VGLLEKEKGISRYLVYRQTTNYTCGPACLHSVLKFRGRESPGEMRLARRLGTNSRAGTSPQQLVIGAKSFGLEANVYNDLKFADLKKHFDSRASIIIDLQMYGEGHWVVLVGMNKKNVFLMDPWQKNTYVRMRRSDFIHNWHDWYEGKLNYHTAVIISH
jgi:predicted double-glycine peptidase